MGEMEYGLNAGGAEVDFSGDELVRNDADVDPRLSTAVRMKNGVVEDEAESIGGKSTSIGIVDSC
jgi:hypothetical protein